MADFNGNPGIWMMLNDTLGPGGEFHVADKQTGSGVSVLKVYQDGKVQLYEEVYRPGTLVFHCTSTTATRISRFKLDTVERVEVAYVGGSTRAEISTVQDSDSIRVSGANVQLNAGGQANLMVDMLKAGTSHLSFAWDATASRAEITTGAELRMVAVNVQLNSTSAGTLMADMLRSGTSRLTFHWDNANTRAEIRTGSELRAEGTKVRLNGTDTGVTQVEVEKAGTSRLRFGYDTTNAAARIEAAAGPLDVRADRVRFSNLGTAAYIADFGDFPGTSFVSRLSVQYAPADRALILETDAGDDVDLVLASAKHVIVKLDYDNDSGAAEYRILNGSGNEIVNYNESAHFRWLRNPDTLLDLERVAGTSNNDARLTVGGASQLRGKVVLGRDSQATNFRAGVMVFEDENAGQWYVWVGTDGKMRISSTAGADPDTTDTNGTVVGTQT